MVAHKFVARFPDEVWQQLEAAAAANGASVNSFLTACAAYGAQNGVSVTFTNTVAYAPITTGTWQAEGALATGSRAVDTYSTDLKRLAGEETS